MKKMSFLLTAASLSLSILMAAPASAAPLFYSFTPTSGGVEEFSFNIDSSPVPVSSDPFSFLVSVQNLTVAGIAQGGTTEFEFYSSVAGGDGGFYSNALGTYLGPQLFSGLTNAPTLLTGTFSLSGGPSNATGILSITSVAAIPEPATWAMMIIGFGLAGSAMRRRKVTTRVSYAA